MTYESYVRCPKVCKLLIYEAGVGDGVSKGRI